MFNFKITIEYDGTNYVGWQKQDNGRSIQEAIENAIFKLTSEKAILFGAGRTDSGVHALGQVAHFNLKKKFNLDNIRDGLNQHLRPQPIAILEADLVNEEFHARFSAIKRTYEYLITNRRSPLTITKNKSWGVFKKLDIGKMKLEAKYFIGKHNLEAFRSAHCQSNSALKTIDDITIINKDNDIIITVSAKSFLHSQVRIMVGTLVEVGKGKITKSIKNIIEDEKRSQAGITSPACGLYLTKVEY
jgi:tRNA pseudouridine38-40 synthase